MNEETKIKMSLAHKGKKLSKEHRQKIGEATRKWHKEFGFSEETRKKLSEINKGKVVSQETREKISRANKGHTGGWSKGLSIEDPRVRKYVEKSAETRRKLYQEGKLKPWNLGKPWSDEIKKKISAKKKGKRYEEIMDPEVVIKFKKRLSELGKNKSGKNNPMYGRVGDKNPHFGKPAEHGKCALRRDLGHPCRSKWESNYARYLLWIGKKYLYEPKTFIIILYDGKKATYTPGFLMGNEWHELKGWEDRSQVKKWEFFKQQYPNEKFILIDRKRYKEIERTYKYIIPNWEF